MPNAQSPQTLAPSTPADFFAQFNPDTLKKRLTDLNSNTQNLPRNEPGELLFRYYQDKSLFDKWASWWYDLPVLHKTSIATSFTVIAGLIGALTGLAIPLIAAAAGIFLVVHLFLTYHEEHRRARGKRFIAQTEELTQQLVEMKVKFKEIAADMTKTLEQVQFQATVMLENNAKMSAQTQKLDHDEEALTEIIESVGVETKRMQKAKNDVVQAVDNLTGTIQFADSSLTDSMVATHELKGSIDHIVETTNVMHQVGLNIDRISSELNSFIQQTSVLESTSEIESDREFEETIKQSRQALAIVRQLHAQPETTTISKENGPNIASIAATLTIEGATQCIKTSAPSLSDEYSKNLSSRPYESLTPSKSTVASEPNSDLAHEVSRQNSREVLALAQQESISPETTVQNDEPSAPPIAASIPVEGLMLPIEAIAVIRSDPNSRTLNSPDLRVLTVQPNSTIDPDSDLAYEMSRQKSRNVLAMSRAKRAQEQQNSASQDSTIGEPTVKLG